MFLIIRGGSSRIQQQPSWKKRSLSLRGVNFLYSTTTGSGANGQQQQQVSGTIPKMGEGIAVGQYAEVQRIYTTDEVAKYGDLIQDKNILHTPMDWNELLQEMPHLQSNFDAGLIQLSSSSSSSSSPDVDDSMTTTTTTTTKPLVHGMMVSSLFSSIFATLSPGCVYMNQSLNFAAPVFVDELVTGRIEIEKVRRWRRGGVVVQCDTKVVRSENKMEVVTINGTANVWLPSGYEAK